MGDITESHIYYTIMTFPPQGYKGFSYDSVIALNRDTFKIDWHYAFEETGLGTNSPKIAGDKLYQLDLNQTLHIFEKENKQ